MFCPKCHCEYVEGIKECPDCNVLLVKDIPHGVAQASFAKSTTGRLKLATIFAAALILVVFLLKCLATLIPGIFGNPPAAIISSSINLLKSLSVTMFFIIFFSDYARRRQPQLKSVALLAVTGTGAVALLDIKTLLVILQDSIPSWLSIQVSSRTLIEPLIPLVASVLLLYFYIVFRAFTLNAGMNRLSRALRWAVVGALVNILITTSSFIRFIIWTHARPHFNLYPAIFLIALPLMAFSIFTMVYFMFAFYREIDN